MDQIAIVGGGASGLAAAVEAASRLRASSRKASVIVYESTDKVGRSILRSGNGRCNYTNASIGKGNADQDADLNDQPAYHNQAFVNEALCELERIRPSDNAENAVQAFFGDLGLMHREEGDGRLFPLSGKASTILNLLRNAAKQLGVRVECSAQIDKIEARRDADSPRTSFMLRAHDGRIFHAERVILATGGNTAASILSGMPAIISTPTRPALAPLALREAKLTRRMDNIRIRCTASLLRNDRLVAQEKGEVLFRKYGISGIAVFNLSRDAIPGDTVRIEIVDWMDEAELEHSLAAVCKSIKFRTGARPTCADMLRGIVQDPVADVIALQAQIDQNAFADKEELAKLAATLKALKFTVAGIGDASLAQVHRGGIEVSCVNAQSMESLDVPGLYVTGEALDVDGPCGGYNLHWAWASGMLAGAHVASRIMGDRSDVLG